MLHPLPLPHLLCWHRAWTLCMQLAMSLSVLCLKIRNSCNEQSSGRLCTLQQRWWSETHALSRCHMTPTAMLIMCYVSMMSCIEQNQWRQHTSMQLTVAHCISVLCRTTCCPCFRHQSRHASTSHAQCQSECSSCRRWSWAVM